MTGVDFGRFGQRRSRQELLEEHAEALRIFSRSPGLVVNTWTHDHDAKPAAHFPTPPPLQQCLPIHVCNLEPGTTHRGRLLRGRVAVQRPVVLVSIQLLIEDELGELTNVSIYNMLHKPRDLAPMETYLQAQTQAQHMFQQGRCFAILEPFFKIQADGAPGVRVDNPAEIIFLDTLGPSTPTGWQQEGGRHFAAQQYCKACRCFSLALCKVDEECGGTLCAVLLNLSAASHKLGSGGEALLWAAAAQAVDQASGKALYRCALALDVLGLPQGVLWAVSEAASLGAFGGGPDAEALMCAQMSSLKHRAKGKKKRGGEGGREQVVRALGTAQAAAAAGAGSSSAAAAKAAKERGNALFKAGEYEAAVHEYLLALGQVPGREQAAVLVSNRAACHLQMGGPGAEEKVGPRRLLAAVADASSATALSPALVKPHFRRGSALLQLEWLPEAGTAVQQGLRCVGAGQQAALLELRARVASAAAAGARLAAAAAPGACRSGEAGRPGRGWTGREPSGGRGERGVELSEGEMHALQGEGSMDGRSVAMLNAAMQRLEVQFPEAAREVAKGLGLGLQGVSMLDERVAPIHQEFAKEGRWPPQCDVQVCGAQLMSAYEHARGMRLHELALAGETPAPLDRVQPLDLLKRLGCLSEERVGWLTDAPMGDISFHRSGPYNSAVLHSFSNVPICSELLKPSSTHVAVGFVDLGSLCEACMLWEPEAGAGEGAPPLRWVGYEASAYCVAKTLVLGQMLREGADTDHVLQVWYSAAWSQAALAAFRRALTAVLQSSVGGPGTSGGGASSAHGGGGGGASSGAVSGDVLSVLRGWQLHDVPLAQSRRLWIKSCSQTCAYICNFKRKMDRLALCRYALTGQLLEAEVGSVVMFCIPEGLGNRSMDESVLQTIHSRELFQQLLGDAELDVMEAAVGRLRRRICCLSRLVSLGRVQITLHHQAVSPGDRQLHASIRALSPWTMSWSNVPDYCDQPRSFHSMARACSGPQDTVHYVHSMNWPMDIKGACHLDLQLSGVPGKTIMQMLRQSEEALTHVYRELGWDRLLLSPPVDNPRNVLDFSLYTLRHAAWVSAFFKEAGLQDVGRQSMLVEAPLYSVLNRTSSTLGMTYSFDPHIRVNSLNARSLDVPGVSK